MLRGFGRLRQSRRLACRYFLRKFRERPDYWWLRSPGTHSDVAYPVDMGGYVFNDYYYPVENSYGLSGSPDTDASHGNDVYTIRSTGALYRNDGVGSSYGYSPWDNNRYNEAGFTVLKDGYVGITTSGGSPVYDSYGHMHRSPFTLNDYDAGFVRSDGDVDSYSGGNGVLYSYEFIIN